MDILSAQQFFRDPAQQRALSGTVCPDDADLFRAMDPQADLPGKRPLFVRRVQPFQFQIQDRFSRRDFCGLVSQLDRKSVV